MVTKRIRSEYMKKFRDPKWETYAKCYEDLVNYRLLRRLLEQTHNPWFWDEYGSDTESSGKCTPQRAKEADETAADEEHGAEPDTSQLNGQVKEDVNHQEQEEEKGTILSTGVPVIPLEKNPNDQSNTKSKPRNSYKPTQTKAKHYTSKDNGKESKHPFAMYGSGDRQVDMASKRTHNVGPAASTKEIHTSALQAKSRRETEKQMKRTDKRRSKSADLEKLNRSKLIPDYNPWMTEYMRCFSARSR